MTATDSAKAGTMRAKAAAAKARAQRASIARQQAQVRNQYGQALGGEIARVYAPAMTRGAATAREAAGRVSQAKTAVQTARESEATYNREVTALGVAGDAQIARTVAGAQPSLISARSAMAQADAYAKQVGIDMKKMTWEAKASVYQSIIDNNMEMVKMEYQKQAEMEMVEYQANIATKAAEEQALAGAPAVVSTVTTFTPGMIADVQENVDNDETTRVEQATAWAAGVTADPIAQAVLIDAYTKVAAGGAFSADGKPNLAFIQNTITESVLAQYPSYELARSDVQGAVTASTITAGLNTTGGGGDEGHPWWTLPGAADALGDSVSFINDKNIIGGVNRIRSWVPGFDAAY